MTTNSKEYSARYRETHRDHIQEYWKKWYDPEKARDYRLKYHYGITLEDYSRILKEQNGLCAICKATPVDKNLSVDHDHETGKVRGLLCRTCNAALGWIEDPEFMDSVQNYLKIWKT